MSIWQRLDRLRRDSQQKKKYSVISGELPKLNSTNSNSAAQENRKLDEISFDSLAVSQPYDPKTDVLYQLWIKLSPREQQVTALTCLKYTDDQIAARLRLSKATVRTYIVNTSNKLGLQSKADLRVTFANWDFSEWEK